MVFAFFAAKAGKDLSTDSMIASLESGEKFQDIFNGAPVSVSRTDHLGVESALIAQIRDGRWKTLATNQSFR